MSRAALRAAPAASGRVVAAALAAASPIVGLPWGCRVDLPPLSHNNMWKAAMSYNRRTGKRFPSIVLDPRVQQWKDDMQRVLSAAEPPPPRLRRGQEVWLVINLLCSDSAEREPDVLAYTKVTVDMLAELFSRGAPSEAERWNDRGVRRVTETKWPSALPAEWGLIVEVHPWVESAPATDG